MPRYVGVGTRGELEAEVGDGGGHDGVVEEGLVAVVGGEEGGVEQLAGEAGEATAGAEEELGGGLGEQVAGCGWRRRCGEQRGS